MYQLAYLPIARQDLLEIARYIKNVLSNRDAAVRVTEEIILAAEQLREFPYTCPMYYPQHPLKHDYRKLLVKNYLLFYWVDEATKTITVARLLYAKRDYEKLLRSPTM